MFFFPYWTGDDADIFGILFEPVVHVLTHSKQVVKAGSLTRRPVAFWHLEHEIKEKRKTAGKRGKKEQLRWIKSNRTVATMNNLQFCMSRKRPNVHSNLSQRASVFHRDPAESSSKLILMPELRFRCADWIKKISWSRCHSVGMKYCYSQRLSDRIRQRRGGAERVFSPFITVFTIWRWWKRDSKSCSKRRIMIVKPL